jgi:hypothetical protein
VSLASIRLGLGALKLDLAVVDLDVDIKLLTELLDVLALAPDKLVGKLLREVKGEGEAALKLVLLLLLDEGEEVLDKVVGTVGRTTDGDAGGSRLAGSLTSWSAKEDLQRDLVGRKVGLLAVDMSSDLIVELNGCLEVTGDDVLLATNQAKDVLLSFFESTLELAHLVLGRLSPGKLVVGRR